jgi:hypothetical protein
MFSVDDDFDDVFFEILSRPATMKSLNDNDRYKANRSEPH